MIDNTNPPAVVKPLWRHLAGLVAGLGLALALTAAATQSVSELGPKEQHAKVSRLATTFFEHSHYRRTKIDDAVSSQILDRYIKALDLNKMYFLAGDIESFDQYRRIMDDFVRTGRVDAVFEIFKVYLKRANAQLNYAVEQLEAEHDFGQDERYYFDREDMSWATTQDEINELWRKRVKHDLLSLRLAEKEDEDAKDLLRKRYERVLKRNDDLTSDQVFETFMNAYADTLDPHSNYFSPRNADEYNIQMSLQYYGIGASLQLDEDYVTVLDVIAGGPAAADGSLEPKDRIIGVAQGDEEIVDVVGWRLDDVVQLIRGPGDTVVRLQILPAGAAPGSPEEILELVRGKVTLEAQAAKKDIIELERTTGPLKLGVITVPSFYQNYQARAKGEADYASVTRDVTRHIKELEEEGIDGIIMDLRNNGGGQLSEAVGLSGLFIDSGPIVQLREHNGQQRVYRDEVKGVAYDGPLVVLVNRFSASASEIFAAAIQDYGRGLVIGQTTFGKGTVQNIYPLDRRGRNTDGPRYGQLHLTMGKYYRITGGSTQHRGVEPDIALASPIDVEQVGESTRDSALPWDEIASTDFHAVVGQRSDLDGLVARHEQRSRVNPEYLYWLEDIAITEDFRDRNYVSLNYDERQNERESVDARRLDNINRWRSARGLDALESLEGMDDEDTPDIVLDEAAEILADAVTQPLLTDNLDTKPAVED